MANCCACGRAFKVSKPVAVPAGTDTSAMSDSQLRAYYASIAPVADTVAFIQNNRFPALHDRAMALLQTIKAQGGKHTPATKREYALLHQAWRQAFGSVWPSYQGIPEIDLVTEPEADAYQRAG